MKRVSIIRFILFACVACCSMAASAHVSPPVFQILDGNLNQIRTDSTRTVQDSLFFDPTYNSKLVKPYPVLNWITFRINESSTQYLQSAFTATVRLRISTTQANLTVTSVDTSLTINYRSDSIYTNRSTYTFRNGYKVQITVLSVSTNVGWNVWQSLVVEDGLQAMPAFTFSCTNDAIQTVSHANLASNTTADELPVSWGNVATADFYDVEWTYVDSSSLALGRYGNPSTPDPNLIFDNSESRITITGNSYNIPLLYDGSGTLFFRVRSVQQQAGWGRSESNWSSSFAGGLGSFVFKGHQRNLNWQATTSFAEDGKRKSVVQYFDGSLRSRQTVTKDNSTNTVIVAESFYDYQGRPVIQVLPAPTLNTLIGYSQNFNLGTGVNSGAYDKANFDTLLNPSLYCNSGPDSMKGDSGAARYYSPSNPEKNIGFNKFIPDAKGYPFTQVVYTQDNTGRISKQSGVGPMYRLGSGHEAMYFYGSPDQRELDALFGTEVGDHSHYFKSMVRDANGQYSISYTDMHGRTIATALAGTPPDSIKLDKLSSNQITSITENLADSFSNVTKDLVMESKRGILVPLAASYTFTYSLNPQSLQKAGCNSVNVCYDCLYDLEIVITDDCNNQKLPGGQAFDTVLHNFSLASIDTTCATGPGTFSFSFNKFLQEGSYDITKKLSVSSYGMNYYRDSVFAKKNTCKTVDSFIRIQQLAQAAITQCQPSCQGCKDSLGTWTSFQQKFMQRAGIAITDSAGYRSLALQAYQQAQSDCRALCDTVSDFEDIQLELLLDLTTPSGQYANPDSTQDIYSIFYTLYSGNDVATAPAYTRATGYVDGNGNLDSVYDETTGSFVFPQQLSPEAFSQKFKLSWAQALLPFHPEYCKWVQYQKLINSSRWDHRFESVNTYQEALQKGYLNPTGGTTFPFTKYNGTPGLIDQDPIDTCSWHNFKSELALQLSVYTASGNNAGSNHPASMWAYASSLVTCGQTSPSCFTSKANDDSAFNAQMCAGDRDMAWRNFRQLYLDVKHKLINDQLKLLCPAPSTTTLVTANHQPHFSDAAELLVANGGTIPQNPGDTVTAKQQGQSATDSFYYNNCKIYATQWWQQLKPCGYTSADSAAIIPQLIVVCREGSDGNHPFGASSVRPASTYKYRSFRDVLQHFSDSSRKGFNAVTACNAYLITDPPPYDRQRPYSDLPVWSKPDSCQCSMITNLFNAYQQNNQGYGSFSAYVNGLNKTSMSETDLQTLRGLCNTTNPTCKFLQTPIIIPSALQCGGDMSCTNCTQMAQIYSQFLRDYPNSFVLPGTDSASMSNYVNLITNYFNAKLGFKKNYNDYVAFLQQCNIPYLAPSTTATQLPGPIVSTPVVGNAPTSSIRCDTLQNIVASFNSLYPTLAKFNHATVQRKRTFYPVTEYLLSCTGIQKPYPPGHVVNPPKWIGSGLRDSGFTSLWYRNNLTFVKFDFTSFGGSATIDSTNLKIAPVLTDPYDTLVFWCNMVTVWDTTLTCPQLGTSFNGFKIPTFRPMYQYLSPQSRPVYAYDCKTQFQLNIRFSNANFGNVFTSFYNPALGPGNSESFIGSSNSIAQTDPETRPHMEVWYRVDSIYSCKDVITAYFNYRLKTNISYDTLVAVYLQRCGSGFPISCNNSVDSSKLCGRSEPVFPSITLSPINSCSDSTFFSVSKGTEQFKSYSDSLNNNFDSAYRAKCLQAYKLESFTVTHNANIYHYTLYYYDQAGNLVKTIAPEGVHPNTAVSWLDSVKTARAAGQFKVPGHTAPTQYRYNTLNQVIAKRAPDVSQSLLWYDRLGRLVISQNAKQKSASGTENNRLYSYTLYDILGRIIEVGEIKNATTKAMADSISRNPNSLNTWLANSAINKSQITQTIFDVAYAGFSGNPIIQRNLRNRVSYSTYTLSNNAAQYNQGSFYTYDIHGNMDTLLVDYGSNAITATQNVMNSNGNRFKRITYRYDVVSGKINHMAYQPNQADQFFHRYTYDAENRLTLTESSADSIIWEKESRYQYYKHGPLSRQIVGDQLVQGSDYAYTLEGRLKGINATSLNSTFDMGNDGQAGGVNQYVAKDALGLTLNYFAGDYAAINTTVVPFPGTSAFLGTNYKPLFNGNISSMAVNIGKFNNPLFYNYTYDQLNRLTGMDVFNGLNQTTNSWSAMVSIPDYKERAAYDPSGNITQYLRNGFGSVLTMDSLTYRYNLDAQGRLINNRLDRIRDRVNGSSAHSNNYSIDIDDQGTANYVYDSIGNLVKDVQEKLNVITWNVYGKMTEIQRTATTANPVTDIQFTYDAAGNRIGKRELLNTGSVTVTSYVRDVSGNVLAVYTSSGTGSVYSSYTLSLLEQHIYGSSRIAIQNRNVNMKTAFSPGNVILTTRGFKYYELINHLGNVLATISDKKIGVSTNNITVDYYNSEVIGATDYYPGGMQMPGRIFVAPTQYRYGYNGKEKDNAAKGNGNQYDYGMRIYDPRTMRFYTVDRLAPNYPWYSPYNFAGGNPIAFIDLDGLEPKTAYDNWLPNTRKAGLQYWYATPEGYDQDREDWNVRQVVDDDRKVYWVISMNAPGGVIYGEYNWKWYDTKAKQWLPFQPPGYESAKQIANSMKGADEMLLGIFGAALAAPLLAVAGVEIVAYAGGSEAIGSYFAKKSVDAGIELFGQLANHNFDVTKVDWFDVASNYLPINDKWNVFLKSAVKNVIQAGVDYTAQDGWKIAGLSKDLTNSTVQALVGTVTEGIFGTINKQIEKQLIKANLKPKSIEKRLTEIVNKEREAVQTMLKNALVEQAKPHK